MASVDDLRRLAGGGSPVESSTPTGTAGRPASGVAQLRRLASEPESGPTWGDVAEGAQEFSSQFLRGVANTAAPIARLNPIGGAIAPSAEQVAEASGGVVATEEPDTFAGRAGRVSGAAAGAAVPTGGAASTVARSAAKGGSILTRLLRGARNLVASSGQAFKNAPGRFTAGEAALGATAGAGGLAAERMFPDSEAARLTGEILGGTAPQVAPARLAVRGAQRARQIVMSPRTAIGARRRAAQRAQRAPTEGERARAAENLDAPTTRDPETGEPVLTPAQRTESQGLLSLEKSVTESSEQLAREADEQIANANQAIQQSARDIGGDPQDTAATIEQGQEYLRSLMDTRLRIAAQRADERIEQVGQGASREQANRIAREELEKARDAARAQEDELYAAVDPGTRVPTTQSQQALADVKGRLGRAQMKNIPADARSMLNAESSVFLGNATTIRELRGLQQQLREQARRARSAEQFTKADVSDEIANAISEDLAAAGEQSEALQAAVDFGREYRQRFRRGAVGRILGRQSSGGERIRPGETLERTVGGGGPGEREALDEMRGALSDPEVAGRTGTSAETFDQATGDFVRRRFLERAAPEGTLDVNKARTFLRQNEQLLSRMPEVRQELEQAIQAGDVQRIVANRRSSTKMNDPRVSTGTSFVRKGPVQTFETITSDEPGRAARATQELINRANRDESGKALAGLKGGYVDFLLRPENQRDVAGQPFVSGFKLRERRTNPSVKAAEERLLSADERERLDTITRDLVRLERARSAKPSKEGVIGDRPSKVVETVAGISGAAVGRQSAAMTGSGGTVQIPGIMANRFRELVEAGVQDPAERLMRDAVQDEALFRELLQAPLTPDGGLPDRATNRLNAWAAGVLAEHQQRPEQEQSNAPTGAELRSMIEGPREEGGLNGKTAQP